MMYPEASHDGQFGKQMLGAILTGAALGVIGPPSGGSAFIAGQAIGGHGQNDRGYVTDEPLRAFFATELKRCFERRIKETGLISMTTQSQAQGNISIDVFQWGFLEGKAGSPLSIFEESRAMPSGWITIEMKHVDGRVLWRKDIDSMKFLSSHPEMIPRRNAGDYERNPALRRQDLQTLADSLARLAAKNLASNGR